VAVFAFSEVCGGCWDGNGCGPGPAVWRGKRKGTPDLRRMAEGNFGRSEVVNTNGCLEQEEGDHGVWGWYFSKKGKGENPRAAGTRVQVSLHKGRCERGGKTDWKGLQQSLNLQRKELGRKCS